MVAVVPDDELKGSEMSLADVNDEQQEPDEPAVVDEAQEQAEQSQDGEASEGAGDQEAESEGVVVSIGDESPSSEQETEQPAPEWVRDLRKKHREKEQENRQLRDELAALKAPKTVELGPRPTLADSDYDEDEHDRKLIAWHARKAEVEAQADKQRRAQEAQVAAYKASGDAYMKGKSELRVSDFEDAEATACEILGQEKVNILIHGSSKSATLMYALGMNRKEAERLAAIKDPVKFAFAAGEVESKLNIKQRKAAPLPEGTVRGTAPVRSSDQNLARLEAEAEKTGDRTKIVQYRKAQKLKAA